LQTSLPSVTLKKGVYMIAEDNALVQRVTLSAKEQELSLSLTGTFAEEMKQLRSLHEKHQCRKHGH
jgi:hypothetical protein